jgi:hypothetical protein
MTEEPQKSPEELIEGMQAAQHPISRADVKEEFAVQSSQGNKTVSIVAIIAVAVVLLGCILACAVVAYAVTLNPPW